MISRSAIELDFPGRARVRIAFAAVPIGLALFALLFAWEVANGETRWFRPEAHVVGIAACVGGAIALALAVFALRERGARVTWDEHGITEWRGDGPVVSIPWRDARLSTMLVRVRQKGRTYADGAIEQWSDGQGRAITIASTAEGVPDWLLRRRCRGPTGAIRPPQPPRPGDGVKPDDRGTRSVSWLTWPLRIGYLPLMAFAGSVIDRPFDVAHGDMATLAMLIVTPPLLLRVVRPVVELVKLLREGARTSAARRVELVANEGSVVQAREVDGTLVTFDTAPLHHDDALLPLRRGAVWIVAPRAASSGGVGGAQEPYRHGTGASAGSAIAVDRLEHDGIRRARGALIAAVAVEIAARTALALLPPIACLAIALSAPAAH